MAELVDICDHKTITKHLQDQTLNAIGHKEIAIVGRSNVGKSTLINGIVGQKMADASKTPGKTQSLNFFNIPRLSC